MDFERKEIKVHVSTLRKNDSHIREKRQGMKTINIEKIECSLEKTLLYFLNYIYDCEYQIDAQYVQQFIEKYLGEAKRSIKIPKAEELRANRTVKFVDERITNYERKVEEILKTYENEESKYEFLTRQDYKDTVESEEYRTYSFLREGPNSKIYNFCALIIDCDRLLISIDEYVDSIDLHYYKEAQKLLVHIQENVIMIVNAITSFILDMYADNILDISQNYMIMPDVLYYLKPHRSILSNVEIIYEEETTCREFLEQERTHLFPVLCMCCETIILRKKIDVLKLVLVFLIIIRSPEYIKEWKMYAYQFIEAYKDVFACATLHRLVIQRAELTGKVVERCSDDNTTRMQIIFSLENNDIYILRIDMPHLGEEKLHINMEECLEHGVTASGFPLKLYEEKYFELRKLLENHFDELFYSAGNRIWFRTNFLNKLNQVHIDEEKKERIISIFKEQSHKEIISDYDETEILAFFDEVKKFLERFQLTHLLQTELKRNNEKVYNEVKKIRKNLDTLQNFWKKMGKGTYSPVAVRDCLWMIYGDQGLEQINMSKDNMEAMELSKIFDIISKHCV